MVAAVENDSIIKAAAELIRERAPSDDRPRVDAPERWREIGLDLAYNGHVIVRLRPVDDDKALVEVFQREPLVASDTLRRYHSADGLADLIERVLQRALSR